MNDLLDLPLATLSHRITRKQVSLTDIVSQAFRNITAYQPSTNALISVRDQASVLKEAKDKQRGLDQKSSPLYGLPYVLKDSYVTRELPTTAGSTILKDYLSPYNATVHQRLQQAGAILIGKGNMDAWGHGASSENSDFGPVKNPYNLDRIPGGSTGGVAVAVSTRMCSFGIGEDTGGSIRNPSAWTNITGLKVTYGRVSRYGCIAYASSFDTVGPMAKTASDCSIVLETIAGPDPYDATSSPHKPDLYYHLSQKQPPSLTIGIPEQVDRPQINKTVLRLLHQAADTFASLNHRIKSISMPSLSHGLAVYYLIAPSETSSNLARFDHVRYGKDRSHFTPESLRRIMTGTFALSSGYYDAYYHQALKARTLLIREYQQAFDQVDVILMPTTPTPPPLLGKLISDPLSNMLADTFTVTQNPVGLPSLALPAGFTSTKLPLGIQLTSPMFTEALLLSLGHQFQKHTSYHLDRPPIAPETAL